MASEFQARSTEDAESAAEVEAGTAERLVFFPISIPVSFATHWAYACWIAYPAIEGQIRR